MDLRELVFVTESVNEQWLARYERDGQLGWVTRTTTVPPGYPLPGSLAVLPDGGAVWTGGYTRAMELGGLRFSGDDSGDTFVARLDAQG